MINNIFYLLSIEKFETLTIQKYKKCFLPTELLNRVRGRRKVNGDRGQGLGAEDK